MTKFDFFSVSVLAELIWREDELEKIVLFFTLFNWFLTLFELTPDASILNWCPNLSRSMLKMKNYTHTDAYDYNARF